MGKLNLEMNKLFTEVNQREKSHNSKDQISQKNNLLKKTAPEQYLWSRYFRSSSTLQFYYVIVYIPARKIIANKDIPGLLRKVTKRLAIGSCYYKSTSPQKRKFSGNISVWPHTSLPIQFFGKKQKKNKKKNKRKNDGFSLSAIRGLLKNTK